MSRWREFRENPVFVKEMRVGFREKKVFYALTAWVIIVALFASISSAAALAESNAINELPEAGRVIFEMLFWVQLVLLSMLSPSLTTSAVSGERERQSLDMLLTTHLAPSELIFGKFGFAASFIVLALFSTIPLEAIVFFLGGVSLASFLLAKLILLGFALLCALLGLMLSARETRSAYATGQTYLCLVLAGGLILPMFSILRYAPDVPEVAYLLFSITLLYLLFFFFWKAVNHLEERASHLKVLLSGGLVFYVLWVSATLTDDMLWGNLSDSFWVIYAPFQYLLMGIMLNPIRPALLRERILFAKSLLSRPGFWAVLLAIGTVLPNIHATDLAFTAMSFYTLLAGLGTAFFARGLSINNPSRYPFFLGSGWLLLNVVPLFFALAGGSISQNPLHPSTISPFLYLVSGYDNSDIDLPSVAYLFYSALLFVGLTLCLRPKRPAVPA